MNRLIALRNRSGCLGGGPVLSNETSFGISPVQCLRYSYIWNSTKWNVRGLFGQPTIALSELCLERVDSLLEDNMRWWIDWRCWCWRTWWLHPASYHFSRARWCRSFALVSWHRKEQMGFELPLMPIRWTDMRIFFGWALVGRCWRPGRRRTTSPAFSWRPQKMSSWPLLKAQILTAGRPHREAPASLLKR